MALVLIGSVLSIILLFLLWHWYSLGVSCQLSICFYCGIGTYWGCLVNYLFVSIVAWVLIGSVLLIIYLFLLCHWYSLGVFCQLSYCFYCGIGTHWECLVNYLIVSIVAWYLLGVSCQLSICFYCGIGTHWECLVNYLIVSIVALVLIGSVCPIIYLFLLWHWYSLGVSCQLSICFYCGIGTHWECLVNYLFASIVALVLIGSVLSNVYLFLLWHWYSLGVSCSLSICFYCGIGTHWECLVNCLFVSIVALVLSGSVWPLWHGYSLGVSCQLSICFYCGIGTHWECLVNYLFVSIVALVLIGSVLSIVAFVSIVAWYSLGVSC